MLGSSRFLLALAVMTGLCAMIARFVQPKTFLLILPATWLEATGVLLLFSIAFSLLGIARKLEARQTAAPPKPVEKSDAA